MAPVTQHQVKGRAFLRWQKREFPGNSRDASFRPVPLRRQSKQPHALALMRLAAAAASLLLRPPPDASFPAGLLQEHLYMKGSAHVDIGGHRHLSLMLFGNDEVGK